MLTLITLPDGNTSVTIGYETQWLLRDWHRDWNRVKDAELNLKYFCEAEFPHHYALLLDPENLSRTSWQL